MNKKICCFIGHRKIGVTDELKLRLKQTIERLIEYENVRTFVFGSKSEFNDLCFDVVSDLKNKFSDIERVCFTCSSEVCLLASERKEWEEIYRNALKNNSHFKVFEREIKSKDREIFGKAAYLERNQAMIDMSDFCIFYYDKDYLPPKKKATTNSPLPYQPKSGTALGYKYAKQKKKHIINMFGEHN